MTTVPSLIKKSPKQDRERQVLFGLIEYYIKTGKPVGSNTLKEVGFANLSSATIRNYFANLDEEGYLAQQHSSGGRIPTDKAFRFYATESLDKTLNSSLKAKDFDYLKTSETKSIAPLLQQAAEHLALTTHTAVFLSAPRFDQDFIAGIKLVPIDASRCLCVLITDFGEIKTETLYINHKISTITARRIEAYFNWRLNGQLKPETMSQSEEELALSIYNELVVRYIVNYSQFNTEDIYRTGFSTLIHHTEFLEPKLLASSLAFFENMQSMRHLLKECTKHDALRFWIGSELSPFLSTAQPDCTIIAIPYRVNNQVVGAVGILGPLRLPYPQLFDTLYHFSEKISEALTRNLYKFKITFKTPVVHPYGLSGNLKAIPQNCNKQLLITEIKRPLLEDKSLNLDELEKNNKPSVKKPFSKSTRR